MMFIVARTSDERFLRTTFTEAWSRLDEGSPNRQAPDPRVRLFRLATLKRRPLRALAAALHRGSPQSRHS